MTNKLIKCGHNNEKHKDCFARKEGKCICLSDCNFDDGKCHFYKKKKGRK